MLRSRNQTHGNRPSKTPPDKPNFDASGFTLLFLGSVLKYGRFQASDDLKASQLGPGEHRATPIRGDDWFAIDTTSPEASRLVLQRFGLDGTRDPVVIPAVSYLDCLVGKPDLCDFNPLDPEVAKCGNCVTTSPDPIGRTADDELLVATLGRQNRYAVIVHDQETLDNIIQAFGYPGNGISLYRLFKQEDIAAARDFKP